MPQAPPPEAPRDSAATIVATPRPVSASGAAPPDREASTPPGRVTIGFVLNHIYRVTRFIAQGGMGEVYEGVNINTDERVAIKVILPHLAQEPKIQAMFKKEARTLTRLTHPALVQYRVLAQEPELGVLYIVTEFVDGDGLDELIGEVVPSEPELRALTRRLADGLKTAHELGAVHRDISPDNILLPEGRLEAAKIIDFGIARDGSTPHGTLLGEAFAGKLGYVAPEQLGDHGREVGPWTDVYSLGLVILALAAGGSLDMGLTPAEAVDRRRAGPDLSPLPEELQPVLRRMLEPDPKRRLRSMDEVIAALDGFGGATGADVEARSPQPARTPVIGVAIGVLGVLAAFGLGVASLWPRVAQRPVQVSPASAVAPPEATLDTALRGADCAWMNDRMSRGPDGLNLELSGAAGDPAAAAARLAQALEKSGAKVASIDHSQLRPLPPAACKTVAAFATLHAASSEGTWLRPQASLFHLLPSPICRNDPHQGVSVVTLHPTQLDPGEDISLFRIDETGGVTRIFSSMAEFQAMAAVKSAKGYQFENLGPQGLRVSLCERGTGLKGLLMIRGKPPFDLGLRSKPGSADSIESVSADWIASAGKAQTWRTQMAWYEVDKGYLPAPVRAASPVRKSQVRPAPPANRPAATLSPPRPDRHDTLGTDFK